MSKAPIWAVAAPSARKPRLNREQIAQAALKLADAEGLEALSMRRVAEALGCGTMTIYYYVRTKDDLLTLVKDSLIGETVEACQALSKGWRPALVELATATRTTYLRHAWALHSFSGLRMGPNGLRHIEQSLQAVSAVPLPLARKLEILSIVDDYVVGHCVRVNEARGQPEFDRKTVRALGKAMRLHLDSGEYPELRAMIGDGDPFEVLRTNARFMSEERNFDSGLDALLDGLAKRFALA